MHYEYNGEKCWLGQLEEDILNELMLLSVESAGKEEISDQDLCEALTVNENLASLGYMLKPADILRLAGSKEPGRRQRKTIGRYRPDIPAIENE